jgi:hypothetical protein
MSVVATFVSCEKYRWEVTTSDRRRTTAGSRPGAALDHEAGNGK